MTQDLQIHALDQGTQAVGISCFIIGF